MSTTIDERVVEMRFDNRHFEQNVSQTMSTLDKFKQKLHLDGATKGLENVNSAAKNVNMSGLGSAVDAVAVKFSALQVMGVTTLMDITRTVEHTAKRMISALTIDPVKTGLSEYETKINSIQTIMSNTASKGTTMEDVTRVINELNTYADKTIYNFAEMTRNIGTFTAAGVGLEDSAAAIQGIANLAAASGSSSQQASTAMYQLSQALATGTVKLMDWNSVVNAGMGGEKFQEALKATAREYGVAVDGIIDKSGSFRDSLREEWLTADILNTTLKKFTVEGAKEYANSMQESGKWTKEQADALMVEAQAMEDAATKVKTFTQLWDTLKESAQSGWAQTWEIIIGNFEDAKETLSELSKLLGGAIEGMSNARNAFFGEVFGSKWDTFAEKLEKTGIKVDDFKEKLKETAKDHGIAIDDLIKEHGSLEKVISGGHLSSGIIVETLKKFAGAEDNAADSAENLNKKLEYFQKVVDDVWRGDYGNGEERIKALTEAGYDYATVQDLVNKTVDGHALTIEELSDAQMENLGYTKDQIKAIRELADEAEKSGTPLHKLIEDMQKPSGRELLFSSLTNVIKSAIAVCKSLKEAWVEIFPPKPEALYNILDGLHTFTTYLEINKDRADEFRRAFKGVFAIIDIIATLVAGPIKVAFKLLQAILSVCGVDILWLAANVGDAIVKFRDWIDSTLDFTKLIEKVLPKLQKFAKHIKDWFVGLKEAEDIPKYIFHSMTLGFEHLLSKFKKWPVGIKEALGVAKDVIKGLINGLRDGSVTVGQAITEIGKVIISVIKSVLGIHSPSTVFFEIGKFVIQGLVNGIKSGLKVLWDVVYSVGKNLIEFVKGLDFGSVLATVVSGGMVIAFNKISTAFLNISSAFEGLGDLFEGIGVGVKRALTGLGDALRGLSFNLKAKAILSFAIAIGVLAASVALLSFLNVGKMWSAVGAIVVLTVALGALAIAIGQLGGENGIELAKFAVALIGLSTSLLLVAFALKVLSGIDFWSFVQGAVGLAAIGGLVSGLVLVAAVVGPELSQMGSTFLKLALTLGLLVLIIKMVSGMKTDKLKKGLKGIAALGVIIMFLIKMTAKFNKDAAAVGTCMLGIAAAMLLLVIVVKAIAGIDDSALKKGLKGIVTLGVIIMFLIKMTAEFNKDVGKVGLCMMGLAAAMLMLTIVIRILGSTDIKTLGHGIVAVIVLGGLIRALIAATNLASKDLKGIGVTLLALSVSIGILAAVVVMLGLLKVTHLAKGIVAVGLLALLVRGILKATNGATDVKGNLIAISIAIGVIAASIAILSMIDWTKLVPATLAIAALMGMFALVVKAGSNITSAMGPLVVMTVAIGVLSASLILLGLLPVKDTFSNTLALCTLLLALTGAFAILSKFGTGITNVILGAIGLTALVVPLFAFVGVLAAMQNVQNAISNALALTTLMTAATLMLIPLTLVGALWVPALIGVGVLTTMIVPLFAFVAVLAVMQNIKNATENANLLASMMVTLAGVLVAISIVGPLAAVGVTALANLTLLMVGIGALAVGLGYVLDKCPDIDKFLNIGLPLLDKLAYGIGSMVGNLLAGFTGVMIQELSKVGDELSEFMDSISGFLEGASKIKPEMLAGVKALAETVLILSAANVLDGLASIFGQQSSLASFGKQLPQLGEDLKGFADKLGTFNDGQVNSITCAANAVKALAEAADAIPNEGGWLAAIVGENSISTFGSYLPELGANLNGFATSLGTFGDDQVKSIDCAANAIKVLAEAADSIPNEGGWLGAIVGDNSISTFGAYLPQLGAHLNGFASSLGTFSDEQVDAITCAANAIKVMAEAADAIPNEGGWLAQIVGDNTIATFGSYLPALGSNLSGFATNLGTFTEAQVVSVSCAADAIAAMAKTAGNINGQTEWGKKLFGDNSLAGFGPQLAGFGTNLKDFATNLGTFDDSKVQTVTAAVKAINALAKLADADLKGAKKQMPDFGDEIVGLGSDIKSFCDNLPGAEVMTAAVDNMSKLIAMINDMSTANAEAAGRFVRSLSDLGEEGLDGFVEVFESSSALDRAKSATGKLMDSAVDGVKDKSDKLDKACTSLVKNAAKAIKDEQSKFYDAGSYLVTGFKNGISENSYKAEAKARAMAKAAAKAAEDELEINSPSKVFSDIGMGVPEGMAVGIDKYTKLVTSSTVSMADSAVGSVKKSISNLASVVDTDIDTQPTIRPVVDLTDVRSGVDSISELFNRNNSVGVHADVEAISGSMARRSQNGDNGELVKEFRNLRKDFKDVDRASYNINGITYDDGSNIAEAIKAIVRHLRIEGRI